MKYLNPSVVPEYHRAHRSFLQRWLGRHLFRLMGWSFEGSFPEDRQILIVVAPHTSNWDFFVGLFAMWGLDFRCQWMAKINAFRPPFGGLVRRLGGIPVDREHPEAVKDEIAGMIRGSSAISIAITPEGTRRRVENWKTGFLRIAKAVPCRMLLVTMDYGRKKVVMGKAIEAKENAEQQITELKNYFRQFTPKHPENF